MASTRHKCPPMAMPLADVETTPCLTIRPPDSAKVKPRLFRLDGIWYCARPGTYRADGDRVLVKPLTPLGIGLNPRDAFYEYRKYAYDIKVTLK